MDKNIPNAALLRAYPYFANNQLPGPRAQFASQLRLPLQPQLVPTQLQLPSQPPHPSHTMPAVAAQPPPPPPPPPQSSAPAPASAPETNACEKLIHLARSIRGKATYQTSRVGGEDHDPLFRAYVHVQPHRYSAEGVGRSKLIARRDAATNMIKYINENVLITANNIPQNLIPHETPQPTTRPPQASKVAPKPEVKVEPDEEMEEGELDSDDPGNNDEEQAPFFLDRDPDPELEKEAQDESLLHQSSSAAEKVNEEEQPIDVAHKQPALPDTNQSDSLAGAAVAAVPGGEPVVTPNQIMEPVSRGEAPEPQRTPKRVRNSLEQELPETPSDALVTAPLTATPSDLGCAIPPRKRTKTITREFPTRLQITIFCTYTKEVQNCLQALAEANLFVDLSITVFTTVELPKYVLLGKNVAAEVTVLPEKLGNKSAIAAKLAFAVGANCESMWVARAKHLAAGYPFELSPRTLVLHNDPSLDVVKEDNVIEVMRPTDDVVKHLAGLLDQAKRASSTET